MGRAEEEVAVVKLWKMLVLVPYALIAAWTVFWITVAAKTDLGVILVGALLATYGIIAAALYTLLLCTALFLRWLLLRRRKR